jgi:hypothetical protein
MELAFATLLAAVTATVDTGTIARTTDAHSFSRYQVIVDRSPFGTVAAAGTETPQPNFAVRFVFIGTAKLSEKQPLMAIIQDKEANNRTFFKSAGDSIGTVSIVRVEKSPTAKLVLKQGLETATLVLETKTAPGKPIPSAATPAPAGQAPAMSSPSPVRRVPFQRGG